MKLMLSSFDTGPSKQNVSDLLYLSKYVLCSFWYLKKGIFNELEQLIIQRNSTDDFMLDSGAFSMFSQKNHDLNTYIDDYIHFINEYDIKRYIELDIDPIVGYEEVKNIRKYVEEKTSKKSIPVWHKNRGMDEWLKHIIDYDYVAIGGLVTKEIVPNEYNSLKPMVKLATNNNTKVHGLGFTGQDCYKYGFYSVDSSSWTSGRRFGQAVKFTNNKITNIKKPKGVRANYRTIDRNNLVEWCKFQRFCEIKKAKSCMQDTNFKITKMIGENLNEKIKQVTNVINCVVRVVFDYQQYNRCKTNHFALWNCNAGSRYNLSDNLHFI